MGSRNAVGGFPGMRRVDRDVELFVNEGPNEGFLPFRSSFLIRYGRISPALQSAPTRPCAANGAAFHYQYTFHFVLAVFIL